jgi:hypothetical protein
VVVNGMASLHSLTMILVELFGHNIDYKGLRLAIIAILDMVLFISHFIYIYIYIRIKVVIFIHWFDGRRR